MIKQTTIALGVAASLLGITPATAQSTIYAPYSCVGNCEVQGGCTRAFLFNGQMIFHNEVGQESPGAFTGPNSGNGLRVGAGRRCLSRHDHLALSGPP